MGFFDKIKKGLEKTRKSFSESLESILNTGAPADEEFLEELEETLILADLGMETVMKVMGEIRDGVARRDMVTTTDVSRGLKKLLKDTLNVGSPELNLSTKPSVILVIGVNGVGKTTTIGKIAKQLTAQGKSVTLVAGDTFRAAKARGTDVILIDTAGRLHNKQNLMNELNKISRIVNRELPDAAKEVLLVLDGTTGQNGLIQAKTFKEIAGVTAIAITKLDGTAKGGIVIGVADALKVPVKFVGVGEQVDDLMPFNANAFVDALIEDKKE